MLRKHNQFRPILEPLEDRIVARYSLRPWGEWSPIYQASLVMQIEQPVTRGKQLGQPLTNLTDVFAKKDREPDRGPTRSSTSDTYES